MRWRLWLVVVVTLTAGCGGFTGGTETATVTPVELPETPTPTDQPPQLAPGIAEYGVTDSGRIAAATERAIRNKSYTLYERMSVTPQVAGPAPTRTIERRIAVERPHHYRVFASRAFRPKDETLGPIRNYSGYANGSRIYARYRYAGTDRVRYSVRSADPASDQFAVTVGEDIERYLGTYRTNVTVDEYDGEQYFLVRGWGPEPGRLRPIQNLRVRAYVSESGFVRSLTATYVAGSEGRVSRYRYHFEYRKVGSTTVEKPSWLATARERVNRSTETPTPTEAG